MKIRIRHAQAEYAAPAAVMAKQAKNLISHIVVFIVFLERIYYSQGEPLLKVSTGLVAGLSLNTALRRVFLQFP